MFSDFEYFLFRQSIFMLKGHFFIPNYPKNKLSLKQIYADAHIS